MKSDLIVRAAHKDSWQKRLSLAKPHVLMEHGALLMFLSMAYTLLWL